MKKVLPIRADSHLPHKRVSSKWYQMEVVTVDYQRSSDFKLV